MAEREEVMKTRILEKLQEIEAEEDVMILHAVESGSRAWGFESPDSDYDVRFIYVRPQAEYLRLEPTRDVIEWQLDEVLDINGWDIQKALRLLYKSNPTLFEWSNSPVIYKTTEYWQDLKGMINQYFSTKGGLYHYISTAKSNYREYLRTDMVKLKKYFYVIRPILACKWILKNNCPPPVRFQELADAVMDEDIRAEVEELIEQKMYAPETKLIPRAEVLNDYIEMNLKEIRERIESIADNDKKSWAELNASFQKALEIQREYS